MAHSNESTPFRSPPVSFAEPGQVPLHKRLTSHVRHGVSFSTSRSSRPRRADSAFSPSYLSTESNRKSGSKMESQGPTSPEGYSATRWRPAPHGDVRHMNTPSMPLTR